MTPQLVGSETLRFEMSCAVPSDGSAPLRTAVMVAKDDDEGAFTISMVRLVGDTFAFHRFYRTLRERLADVTSCTDDASIGGCGRRPPPAGA